MVRSSTKYVAVASVGAAAGFYAAYRLAVADYVENNGRTLDAVADRVYEDFDKEEIQEARDKLRSAIQRAREMEQSEDEPDRRMIQ